MALNQDIRSNSKSPNNPLGLNLSIKPMRLIINPFDPQDTDGESQWLWINSISGEMFNKVGNNGATWLYVYSFNTGIPVPGLTNIVNDGSGLQLFNNIIGTTAHFRTLTQNVNNKILLTQNTNDVNVSLGTLNTTDVGIPLVQNTRYVTYFAGPPTTTDDSAAGFQRGNLWSDYANNNLYMCTSTVINNAVWNILNPEFPITTRTDNDMCFARSSTSNTFTGIPSYGTPVLLNIGFGTYTLINTRGTWQAVNSGFGPVNIIYGPPTNGLSGNNYMVTYNWFGNIFNPAAQETSYILGMHIGTGGSPTTGSITGSLAEAYIATGARFTSTTKTFVYNFPTNGTVNFYLTVTASTGVPVTPVTLATQELTITFTQI